MDNDIRKVDYHPVALSLPFDMDGASPIACHNVDKLLGKGLDVLFYVTLSDNKIVCERRKSSHVERQYIKTFLVKECLTDLLKQSHIIVAYFIHKVYGV